MVMVTMMVAMAVDAVALGEKVLCVEQMYILRHSPLVSVGHFDIGFFFYCCSEGFKFFMKLNDTVA